MGLAQFIPIVTASGLIETTLGPLILAGLGFTMLVVGIPFLIHGILVLTQVRAVEKAVEAPTALVIESPWNTRPGPRRTVLLRF